jgi:putative hydrolase of the HAD superfamily
MIELITFDLDNTLWDVTPVIQRAERAMLDFLGNAFADQRDKLTREHLWQARQHILLEQPRLAAMPTQLRMAVLRRSFSLAGMPSQQIEAAAQACFDVFMEQRNQIDLYPQTLPLLSQLSAQFALIALSNGNADLRRIGLHQYFVAHFSAESTGKPKPDPAMFQAALNTAQVAAGQSIHIGDHPLEDVAAANRLGMRTVWFNPGGQQRPPDCKPDLEIARLEELPAAIEQIVDGWD